MSAPINMTELAGLVDDLLDKYRNHGDTTAGHAAGILNALADENAQLRRGLAVAVSRGCNHCAASIRQGRVVAGLYPSPGCAE